MRIEASCVNPLLPGFFTVSVPKPVSVFISQLTGKLNGLALVVVVLDFPSFFVHLDRDDMIVFPANIGMLVYRIWLALVTESLHEVINEPQGFFLSHSIGSGRVHRHMERDIPAPYIPVFKKAEGVLYGCVTGPYIGRRK